MVDEPKTVEIRQTKIFVPPAAPFDGVLWAPTLLGEVVAPLVGAHPSLQWFWFSRYGESREDSGGDCDLSEIPESLAWGDLYFSLRLRYAIPTQDRGSFEDDARRLIDSCGAKISGFLDYDWLGDLGGPRFVGEDRSDPRRQERVELVTDYLTAVCRLTLHCLQGPDQDGRHRLEHNDDRQNPLGSTFESLHHLFCNITDVPLVARIQLPRVGTFWQDPTQGPDPYYNAPLRF